MVATGLQVVVHIQRGPHTRHVVVILGDTHGYAPEFTTAVVLVQQQGVPAVGIHVETTLGVDVALAFLEGGFNHMHPVQLPAGQIRVEVGNTQNLGVRGALFANLVVVVGNVDFPHPFIVPVIAIHGTVEDVGVVGGTQIIRRRDRRVITQVRCPAHTALAGVITPTIPRADDLVQGFMDQDCATGKAGRRLGERQVVENDVIEIFFTAFRAVEVEKGFLLGRHQAVIPVGLHGNFTGTTGQGYTAPAGQMVPDHLPGFFFVIAMKDRERIATVGAIKAFSLTNHFRIHCVLADVLGDPVRNRVGATGLVNRNPEGRRIGFKHGLLAIGQVLAVLVHVGRIDGEQHLVIRKRVDMVLATALIASRGLCQATVPRRDGAIGVSGLNRTERGQVITQPCCF